MTATSRTKLKDPCQCHYLFLSPQAARELPRYQYHGQDDSYLYAYILSPLANFLVEHCTPSYIAPNTITLAGLLFVLLAHCLFWYYTPTFAPSPDIPSWVFGYAGCATLIYQTLDNMDGKQARKTSTSSPLGLLFDHGCDAINMVLTAMAWWVAMGWDPALQQVRFFMTIFLPLTTFYINTWEHYYTGKLILPVINGPSEGLLGAAATCFVTAGWGVEWWQTPRWEQWCAADVYFILAGVGLILEALTKIGNTVTTPTTTQESVAVQLRNLTPMLVLGACFALVDSSIWLRTPRTSIHLIGVLYMDMTTDLMFAHMTKQAYSPVERGLV